MDTRSNQPLQDPQGKPSLDAEETGRNTGLLGELGEKMAKACATDSLQDPRRVHEPVACADKSRS